MIWIIYGIVLDMHVLTFHSKSYEMKKKNIKQFIDSLQSK